MSTTGDRLRIVLAWKGLKGAALSRKLGLRATTRQVQGWTGGIHAPTKRSLLRVAKALRLDVSYFCAPLVLTAENELLPLAGLSERALLRLREKARGPKAAKRGRPPRRK